MTRFSIIVPTRNRPEQLAVLLESLNNLDYPKDDLEVIVVDDGGERPARPIVERFPAIMDLRCIDIEHSGPGPARQAGVTIARGRYIAFTDDDCRPATDWLRVLDHALEEHPDCAVGGRTENALGGNPFAEASERLVRYAAATANASPRAPRFFPTNNVGFPLATYRAVGGLDSRWSNSGGEERDLFSRWQDRGFGMVFEPRMVVRHAHALGWGTFLSQHFRYGRGAYLFRERHVRQRDGRIALAQPSFYLRVPVLGFADVSWWLGVRIAFLLLLAQAANAAGFTVQALAGTHPAQPRCHSSGSLRR